MFLDYIRIYFTNNTEYGYNNYSAGVGRSGTYIALTMLLKHLKHNKKISVFEIILQMREQRANMVQTQV